jgi:MATE family multidrug resistance protein
MNKKILQLAIPNIVTNITIPLLGMVDIGLMGHMGSAVYLGAIALGTMIFNILFWGFSFLRMGTTGFTAQAYGSRNLHEAVLVLSRALVVALAGSLLLIILQWPIVWLTLKAVHSSAEVESLARQYFYIRIYSAPATFIIYAITGWLIGMQNARSPMMLAISVNILNIIFSLAFIKLGGMASNGIALANVCSQWTGLGIALLLMRPYFKKLRKHIDFHAVFDFKSMGNFLHVNKDIFIRTLCLIFTFSFFTMQSANISPEILAINTVLFQFLYFFSYFVDGFAYAAEALTGRYKGAGDPVMLKRLVKRLFVFGSILAAAYTLMYGFAYTFILELLTNNADVLSGAGPFMIWIILLPAVSFAAFIWDGVYLGATASKAMRNSMVIITFGIFLPAYFILKPYTGNHALWMAMLLFMAFRGIILSLMSRKTIFAL